MPAPISVIIPTLNAAQHIGPTLGAVSEALSAGLLAELIIADGGSDDDIATLADYAGARLITGAIGRGAQLAAGAAAARGDWLLFLHADTVLQPAWVEAVIQHMAQNRDRAGYFRLRFDARGLMPRLIAAGANLRSRWLHLPYGDQGLLISRAQYNRVGGYEALPLMEDVAMARKLGHALVMLNADAVTRADRYRRDGWLRRPLRNLWTLARYFLGVNPEKLARGYSSSDANCRR